MDVVAVVADVVDALGKSQVAFSAGDICNGVIIKQIVDSHASISRAALI